MAIILLVVFAKIDFSQLSSIIQSNTNVTAVAGVLQCHISDPDKDVNTWKRTTIPWQGGGDIRLLKNCRAFVAEIQKNGVKIRKHARKYRSAG